MKNEILALLSAISEFLHQRAPTMKLINSKYKILSCLCYLSYFKVWND